MDLRKIGNDTPVTTILSTSLNFKLIKPREDDILDVLQTWILFYNLWWTKSLLYLDIYFCLRCSCMAQEKKYSKYTRTSEAMKPPARKIYYEHWHYLKTIVALRYRWQIYIARQPRGKIWRYLFILHVNGRRGVTLGHLLLTFLQTREHICTPRS